MALPFPQRIIHQLDEQILSDPSIGPTLFASLLAQQRELGLLHRDRPTCPFLRPHILTRSRYETIAKAAATIAQAFEQVAEQALKDDDLLSELGLTAAEEKMARIDPGYSRLCVTSRLDAYLTESDFQFFEYNADSPAGVGDQMQLEKTLFRCPGAGFSRRPDHWLPQPHRLLLASLLEAYREWGGVNERPQIAIVDWEGVATASEFEILRNYFESEGLPSIVVDPRALAFDGRALSSGNFRIDIVYKRVIIHEFLERCDENHPLARAYAERRVCMANSFRTKLVHKKAGFAVLSDPRYKHLFTAEQLEVIERHIPWTRRVHDGLTTFAGAERELLKLRSEQERLVLKPNGRYGGAGVLRLGTTPEDQTAIAVALTSLRAAARACREDFLPMFGETLRELGEAVSMIVDFNPFLFHNKVEGALGVCRRRP
jgi:hypothetical protein